MEGYETYPLMKEIINPAMAGAEVELVNLPAREYRLKKALITGSHPFPFLACIHHHVCGNGNSTEIPLSRARPEGDAAIFQEQDQVQVTAHTPITARVGADISNSINIISTLDLFIRPFFSSLVYRIQVRPCEYGRIQ